MEAAAGAPEAGVGLKMAFTCARATETWIAAAERGDMAASETYAHLEHLRILGQATRDEVAGQTMYSTS